MYADKDGRATEQHSVRALNPHDDDRRPSPPDSIDFRDRSFVRKMRYNRTIARLPVLLVLPNIGSDVDVTHR